MPYRSHAQSFVFAAVGNRTDRNRRKTKRKKLKSNRRINPRHPIQIKPVKMVNDVVDVEKKNNKKRARKKKRKLAAASTSDEAVVVRTASSTTTAMSTTATTATAPTAEKSSGCGSNWNSSSSYYTYPVDYNDHSEITWEPTPWLSPDVPNEYRGNTLTNDIYSYYFVVE